MDEWKRKVSQSKWFRQKTIKQMIWHNRSRMALQWFHLKLQVIVIHVRQILPNWVLKQISHVVRHVYSEVDKVEQRYRVFHQCVCHSDGSQLRFVSAISVVSATVASFFIMSSLEYHWMKSHSVNCEDSSDETMIWSRATFVTILHINIDTHLTTTAPHTVWNILVQSKSVLFITTIMAGLNLRLIFGGFPKEICVYNRSLWHLSCLGTEKSCFWSLQQIKLHCC